LFTVGYFKFPFFILEILHHRSDVKYRIELFVMTTITDIAFLDFLASKGVII